MREIKFRAKRVDDGKWVKGDLKHHQSVTLTGLTPAILVDNDPIISETVGQFIGLTDKNGVEIYEGDILRVKSELNNNYNDYPIEFRKGSFVAWCNGDNNGIILHKIKHSDFEVIGNIHDK